MSCMRVTKVLARAETALLCSRFIIEKIGKGTLTATVTEIRGGIISAGGMLAIAPFAPGDELEERFKKVSRSINALGRDIKKMKDIGPADAAALLKKTDRALKKVDGLWDDVKNKVCKGDE